MKRDKHGQVILNEDDLFDLLMKGRSYTTFQGMIVDDSVQAELFSCVPYNQDSQDTTEFDKIKQSTWFMPQEYYTMDIVTYLSERCNSDEELERCARELVVFEERNLLNLLKYLVYLVDCMKQNNVIWGVGRGSSVGSFVLYLIGIHRVDPLKYDLSFEDFMR